MTKRYLGNIITQNPTAPVPTARPSTLGSAKGVWSLNEALAYQKAGQWPYPVFAPDAPTIGAATAGISSASIAFTAPSDDGGLSITQYTATSSPGSITGTGSSSPVTVSGLTNGTSYTFTVKATTAAGTGQNSSSSNSATPELPPYAVFFNGGTDNNVIDYIVITTTGNASDWGDMPNNEKSSGAVGNTTRAVVGSYGNGNMYYITYASTGNAVEFGTLTFGSPNYASGVSNSTRGVFNTGNSAAASNTIEYITIATLGDTTDFGDQTVTANYLGTKQGPCSTTRGLFGGGYNNGGSDVSTIEYITIASTGNASNFGNVTQARFASAGASSNTRGLFVGGASNGASNIRNTIDYVTIASTGNASDFGDLSQARGYWCTGTSDRTTAVFGGGRNTSYSFTNVIDYVTIASTGNASDFGDLTVAKGESGSIGPSHGGLAA